MAASIAVWAADAEPAPARVVLPVGAGGGRGGLGRGRGDGGGARRRPRAAPTSARQLLLGRGELGLQLRLLGAERGGLRTGGDLRVLRDGERRRPPAP